MKFSNREVVPRRKQKKEVFNGYVMMPEYHEMNRVQRIAIDNFCKKFIITHEKITTVFNKLGINANDNVITHIDAFSAVVLSVIKSDDQIKTFPIDIEEISNMMDYYYIIHYVNNNNILTKSKGCRRFGRRVGKAVDNLLKYFY